MFNKMVMDEILGGKEFEMGFNLSRIMVVRHKRDFTKRRINWAASNALKNQILEEGGIPRSKENPEGENWLVYYTEDHYLHFYWHKLRCKVKNKMGYIFSPTRGKVGNVQRLHALVEKDKLAHLNFRVL